jgi:hypothetical protein
MAKTARPAPSVQHTRQPQRFKRSLHRRIKPRVDPGRAMALRPFQASISRCSAVNSSGGTASFRVVSPSQWLKIKSLLGLAQVPK